MKRLTVLMITAFLSFAGPVLAELNIRVTKAAPDSIPIALLSFAGDPGTVAEVISADLGRTGKFSPMATAQLPQQAATVEQLNMGLWSAAGVRYVVLGSVTRGAGVVVNVEVVDVNRQARIAGWRFEGSSSAQRRVAHRAADAIYQQLLGEPGPFDSRVAYVATSRGGDGQRIYRLNVADSDGQSPFVVLQHRRPVLSPAWSPDGEKIAYVAYERGNQMVVYVQELATGQRQSIAQFPGINGSPSWSPDGRTLVLTLSRQGNPEIYSIPVQGGSPRQLTNNPAIDTEPTFSPDGQYIYFTSDRGGAAQIYRIPASGGRAERVTRGSYAASPVISPNGRVLAYVGGREGNYRIEAQDLQTGRSRVLSTGPLDEAPSFAPNGSMIIFASESIGAGVLAAVSLDGKVQQRIDLSNEGIREPSWSPKRR